MSEFMKEIYRHMVIIEYDTKYFVIYGPGRFIDTYRLTPSIGRKR